MHTIIIDFSLWVYKSNPREKVEFIISSKPDSLDEGLLLAWKDSYSISFHNMIEVEYQFGGTKPDQEAIIKILKVRIIAKGKDDEGTLIVKDL